MAEHLLALHIEKNELTAILTTKNGQVTEVLACGYAKIHNSLAESLELALQDIKKSNFLVTRCVVSLGGDALGFHTLNFPFRSHKKITQVLALELEEKTTYNLDDQVYDFTTLPEGKDGCTALIATIDKAFLTDCVSSIQLAGLDPERITVSGVHIAKNYNHIKPSSYNTCFIHVLDDHATLTLTENHNITVIRNVLFPPLPNDAVPPTQMVRQAIRQTLLSRQNHGLKKYKFVLSGNITKEMSTQFSLEFEGNWIVFEPSEQPLLKLPPNLRLQYKNESMAEVLALALNYSRDKDTLFNFRTGFFATRNSQWYRGKIAYSLSAALLLGIAITTIWAWTDFTKMSATKEQLQQEILQTFSETLPEVQKIVNPVQQLQVQVDLLQSVPGNTGEQTAPQSIMNMLAQLSSSVSEQYTVHLTRIIADEVNIRIKGIAKDFNTVDNIQKDLKQSGFFSDVAISSANLNTQEDDVQFELILSYAEKP